MYDVTSKRTFQNIDSWRTEFLAQALPEDHVQFPFVLVGNKVDRKDERCVSIVHPVYTVLLVICTNLILHGFHFSINILKKLIFLKI